MYATKRATSVNLFRSMYLVWYSLLAVVTDAQQSVRVDGVSCFIMRQQDTPPPLVGDLANGDTLSLESPYCGQEWDFSPTRMLSIPHGTF